MLELVQFMERRYATGFDYRDNGANPTLPFTTSPRNASGSIAYAFSFSGVVSRGAFTLQAVPSALQDNDRCGTMTIDEQGNRTAGTAECW